MRSGKVTGACVVGWWVAPVLLLAMGLASQARAASQAQEPSDGQALTLDKLRQKTGIAWERRVTKKSGERAVVQELARPYPTRRGQGLETPESASERPIDPKDAEARALTFATSHSALLVGGADGVSLPRANLAVREMIAKTYPPRNQDRGTDYTVVLAQLHRNVPVFEAELRISMAQFGEIWSVINGFAVIADPPVVAKLTRDEAIAQARKLLGNVAATPEADPDLCIYPPASLAWHMNFLAPDFQEVLIDATTGGVLLARRNVRDACSVTLNVRDRDGSGLQDAQGQYYANAVLAWTQATDASGTTSNGSSPAGWAACRAQLTSSGVVVRDQDSGAGVVLQDTFMFQTVDGGSYTQTIDLNVATGVNTDEGGQAFREIMRAWRYATANYAYTRSAVTAYVDASSGPSSSGNTLNFPHDRARLDNGPPTSLASIDDTMLHEYGHALQYAAYGGTWG